MAGYPDCNERDTAQQGVEAAHTAEELLAPDVADQIAERLMRSLELMEADYQRTIAATRTEDPEQRLDSQGQAVDGDPADAESTSDANDLAGYAAIGSDLGSSSDEEDEKEQKEAIRPDFGDLPEGVAASADSAQQQDASDDQIWGQFQTPELGWSTEGQTSTLESPGDFFADFSSANPLLPKAPEGVPQLQATTFTDHEVKLIKDTMSQVCPEPPLWAKRLSDRDLQRMVKDLLKE
eukprot:TRINITY_DN112204_c0_g1_i1.p1 TRINITY_DN112204_c0_g1~~TRINITY_DN112204_c0_g1_i1.p1  ORF type:complete len:237 (+),score=74.52 TRINITY_DN112204_c0_g1_i1:57-767(+)